VPGHSNRARVSAVSGRRRKNAGWVDPFHDPVLYLSCRRAVEVMMRESSSGVTPCAAVSVSACTTKTRARAGKLGPPKSAENRVRSWRTTHARRTPLTVTERRADERRRYTRKTRNRRCVPGQLCCSMRGRALWRGEETTTMTTMMAMVQRDDNNPAPLLTAHNEAYPSGLLTFALPSVPLLVQYQPPTRTPSSCHDREPATL
jgi:hypothetical protein